MTMTDTNIHLSGAEISILEVDVDNRGLELISHVFPYLRPFPHIFQQP